MKKKKCEKVHKIQNSILHNKKKTTVFKQLLEKGKIDLSRLFVIFYVLVYHEYL